ncbi:acetylglutamate kinase [Sporosarcina sp. 179-K 3D1 HS]|uniref:acetylglutamate kinase n=1 Tax=Sporosarcina sp. 179-K 3D1 HS TaxID=3232169 RepID=UPI0039A21E44
MTTSKSTPHTERKRVVIKLGGSMLEGLSKQFFVQLKQLMADGVAPIIVHGGGPAINQELAKSGVTSTAVNGIRVTSDEAIGIVQSTLIGKVNPALVQQLNSEGIDAIGLSGFDGQLITCSFLDEEVYGNVGEIENIRTEVLEKVTNAGYMPVLSCIGVSEDGKPLNINGDTVASRIALAVEADSLLLVTDTPGIRIQDEVQQTVSPSSISQWVESGDIYGGMVPKVEAALACLTAGIPSVKIVDQHLSGTDIRSEGVTA